MTSDAMTLDPPGSIAVVGAGPLGLEAALYGRFLGYNVSLIEADAVASSHRDRAEGPLPIAPDRCLSPLAFGALQAQFPELASSHKPTTIEAWIRDWVEPLLETDLLRGRFKCPARVREISLIALADDDNQHQEDESDDEESLEVVPPDFRLAIGPIDSTETVDAEAVLLAVGGEHDIVTTFDLPAPYLFRIGEVITGNAEQDFWAGLKEIVAIYAQLAGRAQLDLYQPRRH